MKYDLEHLYNNITKEQMEEYVKEHMRITYEAYINKINKEKTND